MDLPGAPLSGFNPPPPSCYHCTVPLKEKRSKVMPCNQGNCRMIHYSITRIVVYIRAIDLFQNDSHLFILLINVICS